MPFNLLIGAAPNAIAYESKQFTAGEFFSYGWIPSLVLMAFLAVFCYFIWPLRGCRCWRLNNKKKKKKKKKASPCTRRLRELFKGD